MFKHLLQSYIDLFTLFLSGHITDTELEKRYFDLFQNRDRMVMWPDPVFQILMGYFSHSTSTPMTPPFAVREISTKWSSEKRWE
jgi:hypothetical protein